ncbi:MAG: lysine 5,6-aminomutase subunit alpha [Deltaproteobacteria bacterium]|nr:lysine 5,6-aminomutase subunit alpha [Deltaproteobacteria bacterium]
MARQLNLDRDQLDHCYEIASLIVSNAFKYIERHSSPAVERTTLMLLGVDGHHRGVPYSSLMVEKLTKDQLRLGSAHWWGKAVLGLKEDPKILAEKLARGKIKWNDIPEVGHQEIKKLTTRMAEEGIQHLNRIRRQTPDFFIDHRSTCPHLALRLKDRKARRFSGKINDAKKWGVALGVLDLQSDDFRRDVWHSEDWQRALRDAKEFKAVPAVSGLSTPEQTCFALQSGFGAVRSDGWSDLLKGEVDARRALVDHSFVLNLVSKWNARILSGHADFLEKNPNTKPYQLLALLLLYEQMARRQGVDFRNIMLSVSLTPAVASGDLSSQFAFLQVVREMFSQSPLWFRVPSPSTPFHFLVASFTEQDVMEVAVENEVSVKQAGQALKTTTGIHEEIALNTHGKIGREAHLLLDQTWKCLKEIQHKTLWKVFETDMLTKDIPSLQGPGLEGIFQKSFHYWNPVASMLRKEEEREE